MADETVTSGGVKPTKWHDNGDGSYSPTVFVTNPAAAGGGAVEIYDSVTGAQVLNAAPGSDTGQRALAVRVISSLAAGGGGGGPVTIADGADVAQGATTDAAGANTVIGKLKSIAATLSGTLTVSGTVTIQDGGGSITVDGTVETELTTADLDTGAGADTRAVVGLVRAESGGGLLVGSANPLPVVTQSPIPVTDNAGSLTVDGTVTVQDGGGTLSVDDGAGSLTVDGTVNVGNFPATQPVSGTVTADTELPAAVALADNMANPTVPQVGAHGLVWDGVNWDREAQPLTDAQLRGQPVEIADGGGSITVDGTVSVSEPVSVDDNGGSLTVDGTVTANAGTGTMAVSMATNTPDVTDRAAREVGRVRIWDGTDEATLLPLRTQPATTEKTIVVTEVPNRIATYQAGTIEIAPAITVGVKELLAIWSTGAKDKYIVEIWVTGLVTTAGTAGRSVLRVSTITSAPTGGTEETKTDISGAGASDMANTMRVKTGGGAIGSTFIRRPVWGTTQAVNSRVSEALFQASNPGSGIILRGGTNAGISIDIERAVAHTALVDQWTVAVRWIEV